MNIKPISLALFAALAVPAFGLVPTTHAAQAPDALKGKPALEIVGTKHGQSRLRIQTTTPKLASKAWHHFLVKAGGQWSAIWDGRKGLPLRIYGTGMAAPGSVADPTAAQKYTSTFLGQHLSLLAPGSKLQDFVLVSNEVHRGIRTVGYIQQYMGLPVLGGQLSFRFKSDRLVVIASEAMPHPKVATGGSLISNARLQKIARTWILKDRATEAKVISVDGPMILPLMVGTQIQYRHVVAVQIDAAAPLGRWQVYLDANDAALVARKQTLRFAEAQVRFHAPLRSPQGEYGFFPASQVSLGVAMENVDSESDGTFSWAGNAPINIHVEATGPLVNVRNTGGADVETNLSISPGGIADWSEIADEQKDAQLSAFVHATIAKDKVRTFAPDLSWLDTTLPVNVNIDDACNAYSDGNSINFFVESSQCANTARLADVVYHEFGHSMHSHSIIEGAGAFDGAFSEGLSDYLSASITGDPGMGIGFFKSGAPLRHIDPDNKEHIWPQDVGEIHYTGLIFAGAMWDLRKLLIEQYGNDGGATLADQYFYGAVQRSSNIPSTYIEILLEDDDDGDLSNGTPNLCDINSAFGAHGLRALTANAGKLSVVSPSLLGYEVTMAVQGLAPQCPGDKVASATIDWQLRGDSKTGGEIMMSESEDIFVGEIPPATDGDVVRYKVQVTFEDGTSKNFPDNIADPRYEFYVGETVEIYCTDFEQDPFANGWTHGLSSGEMSEGADDWSWGPVHAGGASGDPGNAYSAENVVGNDLGGDNFDGNYQKEKVNFLLSPKIDTQGYSDIRLQYRRWLNVEDGFFDKASIYSNGKKVWTNFNSNSDNDSTIHHRDREWRFHDIPLIDTAADGSIQIKYEINSDAGLEMGGWTIDDFCIVANARSICGDEQMYGSEECDDGASNSNTLADACRENCLLPSCGDGVVDTGESCDDGNLQDGDGCQSTCLFDGQEDGDCGCVVGGKASPWKDSTGLLLLLGLFGLIFIRSSRKY